MSQQIKSFQEFLNEGADHNDPVLVAFRVSREITAKNAAAYMEKKDKN